LDLAEGFHTGLDFGDLAGIKITLAFFHERPGLTVSMKMVIRTVVKTLTLHRVGKSGARPPICTSEMNNVAKGQALLVVQIQRIRSSMWMLSPN